MKKYSTTALLVFFFHLSAWGQMLSNTKIQMNATETLDFGELLVRDYILLANGIEGKVTGVYHEPNEQGMIYIKTSEGTHLVVDKNQVLQLPNKKLIQAKKVKAGTQLLGLNKVLNVNFASMVYVSHDVSLLSLGPEIGNVEDHLFIANETVVGDYTLTRYWKDLPSEIKE